MLIKDPLQVEPSPYEVLNVDFTASTNEINKAMPRAIMAGKYNTNVITNARLVLTDPQKKAVINLLMYPADRIITAIGLESDNELPLSLDQRLKTIQLWKDSLLTRFPDDTLLHALALAWYWWGEYESDRYLALVQRLNKVGETSYRITRKETLLEKVAQAESCGFQPGPNCPKKDCPWHMDCVNKSPSLQEVWEKSIAYMTLMISTPKIWPEQVRVDGVSADEVCQNLRNRYERSITKYLKAFNSYEATSLASMIGQIELDFKTERMTASLMTEMRITDKTSNESYSLGLGRFLLREVNKLPSTQTTVTRAVQAGQGSESFLKNLRELEFLLSPYANIYHQITRQRWTQALDLIDSLSPVERDHRLVQVMQTQAFLGMGFQEFELSKTESAITYWKKAKTIQEGNSYWEQAVPRIVKLVLQQAAKIEKINEDESIKVLENAHLLLDENQEITTRLANLLTTTGIHDVVVVQKKIEKQQPTQEDIDIVKQGVQRLSRAAALGNAKAKEQLELAQKFLDHLSIRTGSRQAHTSTPPVAQSDIREIEDLRKSAASAAERGSWDQAVTYLDKAHSIVKALSFSGSRDLQQNIEKELSICLTKSAIESVNAILEPIEKGNFGNLLSLKATLKRSESLLKRANMLDPGNAHILKNLATVRDLLKKFGNESVTPKKNYNWVINGTVLVAGLLLLIFNLPQIFIISGAILVIFLSAGSAYFNLQPGRTLAYTGAIMAAAAYILSLFN